MLSNLKKGGLFLGFATKICTGVPEVLHFKMSTYLMHCVGVYSGPPKPRYAGGRCPLPNSDRIRAVKRSPCPPLPQILRSSYGPEIAKIFLTAGVITSILFVRSIHQTYFHRSTNNEIWFNDDFNDAVKCILMLPQDLEKIG